MEINYAKTIKKKYTNIKITKMQIHKLTPLLLLLFCLGQPLSAQLKVVDDNSVVVGTYNAPQSSAKLEVNSSK